MKFKQGMRTIGLTQKAGRESPSVLAFYAAMLIHFTTATFLVAVLMVPFQIITG